MAQCKYAMREHQISYDDGFSWISLEVIKGDLIEYQSADCPDSGSEITKWVDLDGDYICEDNRKYKKQVLYVSYDGGATWYIYFPTIYQKGEYVGIDDEFCAEKFEGHYEGGRRDPLKIVKCNDSTTLTSGETDYYVGGYTLISAKIGDCVTTIGDRAFYWFNRLSAITIPSGITYIGNEAFYFCNSLSAITIPSGITYIGNEAFNYCSGLTSIIVEAITPPTLVSTAFYNTNNCQIYVPCQSVEAYKAASGWRVYASRIQRMSDECMRYRTITSSTCIDGDLYQLNEYQVSTDFGVTWTTTATSATTIIESGSSECGYANQYLTFTPLSSDTTFKFSKSGLSYSMDYGITWISLSANTNTPSVGVGDKIMFKGTLIPSSSSPYGIGTFSSSDKFDVKGNVMSLLYGDDFIGETSLSGRNYVFAGLFSNNTKLISAENLVLPATTLTDYCYWQMFSYCSGLTTAPSVLPATTLANYCYLGMFSRCTNLTTVPQLLATKLATSCYDRMFEYCTSLTTAPELPATTLSDFCYADMFSYCTSLTTAPELLATTLVGSCYRRMFSYCSGLTTAPSVLPATTLTTACYMGMFSGCTSLTVAPKLPATTLGVWCYQEMFYGCTRLNEITCLATNISAEDCTTNWLSGVASSGTFYKNPNMTSWGSGASGIPTRWTVLDCTPDYSEQYLTLVPVSANTTFQFSQTGLSYSLDSGSTWTSLAANTATPSVGVGDKIMFKASGLTINYGIGKFSGSSQFDVEGNAMSMIYGDDFIGQTSLSGKNYALEYLFSGSSVVSAENLALPATELASWCYSRMFKGCTSLTTVPKLLATALANGCYANMFEGCTSLTTVPSDMLPSTTLASRCYADMFSYCSGLTVAPQLPSTTLTDSCYSRMFAECSALTEAPILSAETLASSCYNGIFYHCSSLNAVTCLATDISASNCTNSWLNGVASSGTFYKSASMSSWGIGTSGIPNGWTVLDAT